MLMPDADEVRANAAFHALMTALSQPGTVHHLPAPGEGSIIDALIDRECRVASADPALVPMIARTGAEVVAVDAADHVFLATPARAEALDAVACGSDLYPDDGATVVVRATLGRGEALTLTGPGIETVTRVAVGGLPEGFWTRRARAARYPMGFELVLLDGDRILGVPRSTQVEVG